MNMSRLGAVLVAVALFGATAGPAVAQCGAKTGDLAPQAVEIYQQTKAQALSADQRAQFELAKLYRDGKGVEPDLVRAYAWLNVAARRITDASKERDTLAKCLKSGQELEAQLLSVKLLQSVSSR